MPAYRRGDEVIVYEDPITRGTPEAIATVRNTIFHLGTHGGRVLRWYEVEIDGAVVGRKILDPAPAFSKRDLVGILAKDSERNDARFRGNLADARAHWAKFCGPSTSAKDLAMRARGKQLIDEEEYCAVMGADYVPIPPLPTGGDPHKLYVRVVFQRQGKKPLVAVGMWRKMIWLPREAREQAEPELRSRGIFDGGQLGVYAITVHAVSAGYFR